MKRYQDVKDQHCYLILQPPGIGDTIMVAASLIDQIIKHDPEAGGNIDIGCNPLHAELFESDPKVQCIIPVTSSIFSTPDIPPWSKRDWFDHIVPQELAETILTELEKAPSPLEIGEKGW